MNLIDFHVTKIINKKLDKIYSLLNVTDEKLDEYMQHDYDFFEWLISNGCSVDYEYRDEGGTKVDRTIFNLDNKEIPYEVGYVGQH